MDLNEQKKNMPSASPTHSTLALDVLETKRIPGTSVYIHLVPKHIKVELAAKAVIVDNDGTLVTTEKDFYQHHFGCYGRVIRRVMVGQSKDRAMRRSFGNVKGIVTEEQESAWKEFWHDRRFTKCLGHGLTLFDCQAFSWKLFKEFQIGINPETLTEKVIAEQKRMVKDPKVLEKIQLVPGAVELLEQLKASKIPAALASAGPQVVNAALLKHFGLMEHLSPRWFSLSKMFPDGTYTKHACHEVRTKMLDDMSPNDVAFVGDSITDLMTAYLDRLRTIAIFMEVSGDEFPEDFFRRVSRVIDPNNPEAQHKGFEHETHVYVLPESLEQLAFRSDTTKLTPEVSVLSAA